MSTSPPAANRARTPARALPTALATVLAGALAVILATVLPAGTAAAAGGPSHTGGPSSNAAVGGPDPGASPTRRASGPASHPRWADPLVRAGRSSARGVLTRAPMFGPVGLVTVEDVDGRPVATRITVADRSAASSTVTAALQDPDVLAVSVAETVQLQDAGTVRRGGSSTALAAASISNDPYRAQQWALDTLDAEDVWRSQSGNSVVVAVLDTGVDAGHPDLKGVVLSGTDLVASGNGQSDPNGHGTHVAGLIAAPANNGIGIAGLAQGTKILPVRVLGANGSGDDAVLANGIVWATDHGASVINLSVGSPDYSPAEAAAVAYAVQKGVVVVSAAGNYRAQGNPTIYPAALPDVIGVGATDQNNRVASFSGTGSFVDLVAPGVSIVSTSKRSYYAMDGTSAACPFVAAAAALVRAAAPRLTPAQVSTVLQNTALDVESRGRDLLSGAGLVQPLAAIAAARTVTGPAATSVPASTLSVASAPSQVTYGGTAKVVFRLTVGGKALAKVVVSVCRVTAPSTTWVCSSVATDSAGRASASIKCAGHLTVWAKYAGTPRVKGTVSRPVSISALPRTQLTIASRTLTLTVAPRPQIKVGVQRRQGTTWTTASTHTVPSTGRLTVSGLARGYAYRMSIPATDRTRAAVTGALSVR